MLQWNGNHIRKALTEAISEGLVDTGDQAVEKAQRLVRVRSGRLRDAIAIQGSGDDQVAQTNEGLSIMVGVDQDKQGKDIEYALEQEQGPADPTKKYTWSPYIKPAVQQAGHGLADNIARRFSKKKV